MQIADYHIGTGRVFIVAEMSCSHEGSLDKARYLINRAKICGANAVKFQVFKPECMGPKSDHQAYKLTKGPWSGYTMWQLYEKAQMPWEWLPELFDAVRQCGMVPFASAFSQEGVNALEAVDCPAYKVASPEILDLRLIEHMAATKKPIIISTGMSSMREVKAAVDVVGPCALLHCVAAYPVDTQDMNLGRMDLLANTFPRCIIGLSDHSHGLVAPIAATALGAQIIEKHIMMDWPSDSLDKDFALEPAEFREMVTMVRATELAMQPAWRDAEDYSRQCRRRIVWAKDVEAGTLATELNTRTARASQGLFPAALAEGVCARHDAKAGEPVT